MPNSPDWRTCVKDIVYVTEIYLGPVIAPKSCLFGRRSGAVVAGTGWREDADGRGTSDRGGRQD